MHCGAQLVAFFSPYSASGRENKCSRRKKTKINRFRKRRRTAHTLPIWHRHTHTHTHSRWDRRESCVGNIFVIVVAVAVVLVLARLSLHLVANAEDSLALFRSHIEHLFSEFYGAMHYLCIIFHCVSLVLRACAYQSLWIMIHEGISLPSVQRMTFFAVAVLLHYGCESD